VAPPYPSVALTCKCMFWPRKSTRPPWDRDGRGSSHRAGGPV